MPPVPPAYQHPIFTVLLYVLIKRAEKEFNFGPAIS